MHQDPPKWYQTNWFTLLFVATFILSSIILILYFRGIDPVIADFYIFKPAPETPTPTATP